MNKDSKSIYIPSKYNRILVFLLYPVVWIGCYAVLDLLINHNKVTVPNYIAYLFVVVFLFALPVSALLTSIFLHNRRIIVLVTIASAILQALNLPMIISGRWFDGILGGNFPAIFPPVIASLVTSSLVLLAVEKSKADS